ncbi:MAG: hypothetical protein ABIP64_05620 [Burkholderiales bacterium]
MKRSNALQTLIFLALFLALPGWADNKPTVTIHRQMAGELDETGWALAKSTDGRFSVKTPGKFSDLSSVDNNSTSPIAEVHTIAASNVQGIKFTATRIKFKGGREVAVKQFNRLKVSSGKLKYKSLKPMKLNEYEAMEGELENDRLALVQRTVLLDDDLLTLIVEYPKAQDAVAKRLVPIFFSSVTFD